MLVELLKYSLFGGPVPLTAPLGVVRWRSLFEQSRSEAVTALLYDAVLKLPAPLQPPHEVLFRLAAVARTIEDDNRRRSAALHHFAAWMGSRLSLPTVVVKGSSLARHYPVPLHRECGDNDIYTGSDTDRVARLLAEDGVEVHRSNPRHMAFVYEQTDFECHDYLLYNPDDEPQWQQVPFSEYELRAASGLCRLPIGQEAFFLAKHMEYHAVFFHVSVRLRDLVDWSLLLLSPEFDYAVLCGEKAGSDVACFADLLTHYCIHLFHLPADRVPSGVPALPKGLHAEDFERLYMHLPERHPMALVRVARRSWHYLRYGRQFRRIYGRGMFGRFYLQNIRIALKNKKETH